MLPVAATVAAAAINRRRLMLGGKSASAMMPSCGTKGWRNPLRLPIYRPHPRFRETTVRREPVAAPAVTREAEEDWSK
jgi:hypothetical protein